MYMDHGISRDLYLKIGITINYLYDDLNFKSP